MSTARLQADQRLPRLRAHQHDFGFNLPETDSRVIEQQRLLDRLTADFKRLKERNETKTAAWQTVSHTLSAVETWIKSGRPPGTVLEDHDGPEPKLAKGEDVLSALDRLRRRGRELKADLHTIRSAPYPSAHARAKIRQEVEALALAGAPVVSDLIEHDRSVIWPLLRLRADVVNSQVPSFAHTEVVDVLNLFAFVHKDALLASFDALVSEEADDKGALTHEARQKAEAEVMGDLLAVERDEAALVWSAMAQNLPVFHSNDCSPQAILGCRLVTAPAVNQSPGTSPQHGYSIFGGRRR